MQPAPDIGGGLFFKIEVYREMTAQMNESHILLSLTYFFINDKRP
jgi:hypothetical protein